MPVHDWTRVDAGTFHAFHTRWVSELMGALNADLLPPGYYAMAEQVATRMQTDVLTLQPMIWPSPTTETNGSLAVAAAPPKMRFRLQPDPERKPRRPTSLRRYVAVRHVSGHKVVALIEVVSPANKDRKAHARELAEKIVRSLESGIHVLLLDLLPPGRHDRHGLHGAVWSYFDTVVHEPPAEEKLALASYAWKGTEPVVFLEPLAVGQPLIDMPLFLTSEHYVNVPLEATYLSAYRGMPNFWRKVLEAPTSQAHPSE